MKMPIDQRFIGQRPQVRGLLQLGRIRRQEEQVQTLWRSESLAGMLSSAVEHDLLLFAGSYGLSLRAARPTQRGRRSRRVRAATVCLQSAGWTKA
jgi:hypothetical protein